MYLFFITHFVSNVGHILGSVAYLVKIEIPHPSMIRAIISLYIICMDGRNCVGFMWKHHRNCMNMLYVRNVTKYSLSSAH